MKRETGLCDNWKDYGKRGRRRQWGQILDSLLLWDGKVPARQFFHVRSQDMKKHDFLQQSERHCMIMFGNYLILFQWETPSYTSMQNKVGGTPQFIKCSSGNQDEWAPPTCAFTVCKSATSKVVIYTGNLKCCWRHSAKQGETTTLIIPRNLSLKMKLSSNGGTPSSSWSFLVTGREG